MPPRPMTTVMAGPGPRLQSDERRTCSVVATACSSLSPLHAAWLAGLEDRGGTALDVLLRADTHHVRRNVDHLLADSDVALEDQNAGVMDRVGQIALLNESREAALEEL